jgi:hypothetical protein
MNRFNWRYALCAAVDDALGIFSAALVVCAIFVICVAVMPAPRAACAPHASAVMVALALRGGQP